MIKIKRVARKNPRLYYWIQTGYKKGGIAAWIDYFYH